MPTHSRNPSAITDDGSESSLTSLSDEGLERPAQVPRPHTPPRWGDVPDLLSPSSSNASSPVSTRSYGLSMLDTYPGVGSVVQAILTGPDKVEDLYARTQKHLAIFDDPRYADLDTPDWVRRVSPPVALRPMFNRFTVRNLIKVMYDTAEDLRLVKGKRYVVGAVCACAVDADKTGPSPEQKQEALAKGLQRLASTWAAFMLWPFYAQRTNVILPLAEASSNATPTRGETESVIDDGLDDNRDSELRAMLLRRDGHKCILSGRVDRRHYKQRERAGCADPEASTDDLEVCHIFQRALAVYSSKSKTGNDKFRSMAVTLEILQHYCQLDSKYIDDMELMDKPQNAITLTGKYHTRFDRFAWCLKPKPSQTANCYEVKDYDPRYNSMHHDNVPSQITLEDHSQDDTFVAASDGPEPGPSRPLRPGKRQYDARGVDLPDPELLRLHAALAGVLRMSDAAGVFDSIIDRRGPGNPPVPSADGEAFFKDMVESEGHEPWQRLVGGMRIASSD